MAIACLCLLLNSSDQSQGIKDGQLYGQLSERSTGTRRAIPFQESSDRSKSANRIEPICAPQSRLRSERSRLEPNQQASLDCTAPYCASNRWMPQSFDECNTARSEVQKVLFWRAFITEGPDLDRLLHSVFFCWLVRVLPLKSPKVLHSPGRVKPMTRLGSFGRSNQPSHAQSKAT